MNISSGRLQGWRLLAVKVVESDRSPISMRLCWEAAGSVVVSRLGYVNDVSDGRRDNYCSPFVRVGMFYVKYSSVLVSRSMCLLALSLSHKWNPGVTPH